MRYILDTHCWLWWLSNTELLGKEVLNIIEEPANEIFISTVTSWEIAIKYAIGKLSLPLEPEKFVMSRLERCGFSTIKIEHIHALRVASLPLHHNDPFDRLLIAQSQIEKIPIITADSKFWNYDIEIIKAGNK